MKKTLQLDLVLGALLIVALLFAVNACAVLEKVESSPVAAQLTVQYATLKYIDGSDAKAVRVLNVVDAIRPSIDDDSVTLAILDERLRSYINWERLDAADRLLLTALLDQVKAELTERIGEGLVDAQDKVRLHRVLDWVETAARAPRSARLHVAFWYKADIHRAL